jgi:hypothetical protein
MWLASLSKVTFSIPASANSAEPNQSDSQSTDYPSSFAALDYYYSRSIYGSCSSFGDCRQLR